MKETGEGIKNVTTGEENCSIGLVPIISATEFVQKLQRRNFLMYNMKLQEKF